MIGATAKADQFRTRSANESTKGSRKGFTLLGGGENPLSVLTPEEQRASLAAVWKGLQAQLVEAKKCNDKLAIKMIGQQISDVGLEMNRLRPTVRSPPGLADYFIDVCREKMTKPQFRVIMDEANQRQREALALEQKT